MSGPHFEYSAEIFLEKALDTATARTELLWEFSSAWGVGSPQTPSAQHILLGFYN